MEGEDGEIEASKREEKLHEISLLSFPKKQKEGPRGPIMNLGGANLLIYSPSATCNPIDSAQATNPPFLFTAHIFHSTIGTLQLPSLDSPSIFTPFLRLLT